ncbi:MAG: hypothetical protein AAF492_02455 [Verrucomicrobiota bacterium]
MNELQIHHNALDLRGLKRDQVLALTMERAARVPPKGSFSIIVDREYTELYPFILDLGFIEQTLRDRNGNWRVFCSKL